MSDDESILLQLDPQFRPQGRMGSSRSRRDAAPGRRAPPKTMDKKKKKKSNSDSEESSSDSLIDVEASTFEQRMAERRALSKRTKKTKASPKQVMKEARAAEKDWSKQKQKQIDEMVIEYAINRLKGFDTFYANQELSQLIRDDFQVFRHIVTNYRTFIPYDKMSPYLQWFRFGDRRLNTGSDYSRANDFGYEKSDDAKENIKRMELLGETVMQDKLQYGSISNEEYFLFLRDVLRQPGGVEIARQISQIGSDMYKKFFGIYYYKRFGVPKFVKLLVRQPEISIDRYLEIYRETLETYEDEEEEE